MKKLIVVTILSFIFISVKSQDIYKANKADNTYIYGESIKLFLGDKILVETNLINNSLTNFKIVKEISDSSRTLTIEFKYDKFGNQKASILKVSNPFVKSLNYKAKIKQMSSSNYSETSIVPVYPKIYSMEMWPNKLESIILTEFTFDKE
jgi:hypothetical protein